MHTLWKHPALRIAGLVWIGIGSCAAATPKSVSALPPGTAIPVVLTHTIQARKARAGASIAARSLQIVFYGPSQSIAKGSLVIGHVVESHPFLSPDEPSTLIFQFDKIVGKHQVLPITVSIRAMANVMEANSAMMPANPPETDPAGGTTLIGGDQVRPGEKQVYAMDGDDVGISNRYGVFSRLEPAEAMGRYTHIVCDSIPTLQSVAIFSSRACGLYGFPDTELVLTGAGSPRGEIELESKKHTVEIHSGVAALLQTLDSSQPQ